MQLRENVSGFPLGTCGGGDFVTGNPLAPGDRIIDLDLDIEHRPAWGRVCLSESTVRLMAQMIGWEPADDKKVTKKLSQAIHERDVLLRERDMYRDALAKIIDLRELFAVSVLEAT